MQPNTNALERAFELARCRTCTSIKEIKQRLNAEGYWSDVIEGRQLGQQLRGLIEAKASKTHRFGLPKVHERHSG
jgi:hypothetical protein